MDLMMDFKDLHKDTRALVFRGLIFVALLLVVGLLLIYPLYSKASRIQKDIKTAQADLARQQAFLPEYERLNAMIKEGAKDLPPVPKGEPLAMNRVEGLPGTIKALAAEAGLDPLDVIISPGSLKQGDGRIMLQCILAGDMAGFEEFLRALSGLPHLQSVSRLEMQAVSGGLEIMMELWVALGANNQGNKG